MTVEESSISTTLCPPSFSVGEIPNFWSWGIGVINVDLYIELYMPDVILIVRQLKVSKLKLRMCLNRKEK